LCGKRPEVYPICVKKALTGPEGSGRVVPQGTPESTHLLERHGVRTEVLRTDRPGYVVYEDEYQVAAIPFRGTREG
jgi:hypothetical protein